MSASNDQGDPKDRVGRRGFLKLTALAGAAATLTGVADAPVVDAQGTGALEEATIADLQAMMESGRLTSSKLLKFYESRINKLDQSAAGVNSVIELNPDARDIAKALDRERKDTGPRGPLHGIPVLLKDNIDTADGMMTTAGSLALVGEAPPEDSTVAARLRAAGALILGKANLSEWANFRGFNSTSGWSGRGGLTHNPYALDRNPCGSSSGSAAAVSANFAAAALGTETDGSIVCPAHANGVVGIKPTVGLTSRAGVVPISHTQDTVGPHARTVADAAAVLGALTGVDPRDPATAASEGHFFTDYTQFLDADGLSGARIGVARQLFGFSAHADLVMEAALEAMRDAGATIVDPVEIPSFDAFSADSSEIIVLIYEFKRDLNAYLATRTGVPIQSLADAIAFNEAHADQELKFFGQEFFTFAEIEIFSEQDYEAALVTGRMLAAEQGIDAVLDAGSLDAIVAPTGAPAWTSDLVDGDHFLGASSGFAAVAGYPIINVPAGNVFGLPVGISFMASAFSEPALIKLAYAFEQATNSRQTPGLLSTLPLEAAKRAAAPKRAELARETLRERMLGAARRLSGRPWYL